MATFAEVFQRKEVKYLLNARQHDAMRSALARRMRQDEYGRTRVTSLYFDTPDRSLIDRSLEKPLYKEKLRVRWYGSPNEDDRVFVEIKKKYKGIVYKRRLGCSLRAARAYLGGMSYRGACARFPIADETQAAESLSPRSLQIASEVDRFVERCGVLVPSMLVSCDRVAYAAVSAASAADEVRVTFDEGVSYRDVLASGAGAFSGARASLARGANRPLLPSGCVVMEIKAARAFPLWLSNALSACKARPTSFSKYGSAYRACASGAVDAMRVGGRYA